MPVRRMPSFTQEVRKTAEESAVIYQHMAEFTLTKWESRADLVPDYPIWGWSHAQVVGRAIVHARWDPVLAKHYTRLGHQVFVLQAIQLGETGHWTGTLHQFGVEFDKHRLVIYVIEATDDAIRHWLHETRVRLPGIVLEYQLLRAPVG